MPTRKRKSQNEPGFRVINKRFEAECPLSSLRPHPANPRQGDVGAIHFSIEHNGFYGALIVQESTGYVLAGNHRYIALAQKSVETVPVIWVDCTDAEARRILVSDNRHNDLAAYDNAALAELLEQIRLDDTDLALFGTGWDEEDYQKLLRDLGNSTLFPPSATSSNRSSAHGTPAPDSHEGNWQGLPEFHQDDLMPDSSIKVNFRGKSQRDSFAQAVGQSITDQTRSIWYPQEHSVSMRDMRFVGDQLDS